MFQNFEQDLAGDKIGKVSNHMDLSVTLLSPGQQVIPGDVADVAMNHMQAGECLMQIGDCPAIELYTTQICKSIEQFPRQHAGARPVLDHAIFGRFSRDRCGNSTYDMAILEKMLPQTFFRLDVTHDLNLDKMRHSI